MERERISRYLTRLRPALARALGLGVVMATVATGAQSAPDDPRVEAGRRIYEQGLLPDGTPLIGTRPDGFVLRGAEAACGTCHRRSGYGSREGQVFVPPAAGPLLFAPAPLHDATHVAPQGAAAATAGSPIPRDRAEARPAYDERSLARALREGLDPSGLALVKRCRFTTSTTTRSPHCWPICASCRRGPPPGSRKVSCTWRQWSRPTPRRGRGSGDRRGPGVGARQPPGTRWICRHGTSRVPRHLGAQLDERYRSSLSSPLSPGQAGRSGYRCTDSVSAPRSRACCPRWR